jgi:uncharacterized protein involved in exopolysaccharide biosynthesis
MHLGTPAVVNVSHILKTLQAYPLRWILPALFVAGAAALYAQFAPPVWEASQAVIVRNEVTNAPDGLGKFNSVDAMKTVQETILELVKSRGVLEGALIQAGISAHPSSDQIAELRDDVKLTPPKGAEFGRTEIFYLKARSADRPRAVALNTALWTQLQRRFQDLRDEKAQSMIAELTKAVNLARADLEQSTVQLNALEKQVGSNLPELRRLHESGFGESALQRTLTEISAELRQARNARQNDAELVTLLTATAGDPQQLLVAPNRLLDAQPALRRLKEGVIDAQLRTAQLQGRMAAEHPLVQASREAEREAAESLHRELAQSVAGLQVDARLSDNRVAMLETQQAKVTAELTQLAGIRANYSNLLAETRSRETLLQKAEQNLGEARGTQAAAKATSLLACVDAPDTGVRPISPGGGAIALTGILGGLIVGCGGLFLTVPPAGTVPARFLAAPAEATVVAADDRLSLKKAWQAIGGRRKEKGVRS